MKNQIAHEAIFKISKQSKKLTDRKIIKKAIKILQKQEPNADIYGILKTEKFVRILWYSNYKIKEK